VERLLQAELEARTGPEPEPLDCVVAEERITHSELVRVNDEFVEFARNNFLVGRPARCRGFGDAALDRLIADAKRWRFDVLAGTPKRMTNQA